MAAHDVFSVLLLNLAWSRYYYSWTLLFITTTCTNESHPVTSHHTFTSYLYSIYLAGFLFLLFLEAKANALAATASSLPAAGAAPPAESSSSDVDSTRRHRLLLATFRLLSGLLHSSGQQTGASFAPLVDALISAGYIDSLLVLIACDQLDSHVCTLWLGGVGVLIGLFTRCFVVASYLYEYQYAIALICPCSLRDNLCLKYVPVRVCLLLDLL